MRYFNNNYVNWISTAPLQIFKIESMKFSCLIHVGIIAL
jgi:hypothetical protein